MRTISKVHSAGQRQEVRLQAERKARQSMIRLISAASMVRTVITQILPLAGSAGWWVTLMCMLPGVLVWSLWIWVMRRTDTSVWQDCLRVTLGRAGVAAGSVVLAAMLLLEGTACMTALVTFFTEGIGTEGTQFTLALLTTGVLCFCLNRDGLPRGILLLRWVILPAAVLTATNALLNGRADHVFPLWGGGREAILETLRCGWSLGWSLTLLLTAAPVKQQRRPGEILPVLGIAAAEAIVLCISLPHEVLTKQHSLSGSLLGIMVHWQPAVQTVGECMLMLVLFLEIGAAAHLATDMICMQRGKAFRWLPYGIVSLWGISQWMDVRKMWQTLCMVQGWMLLPVILLVLMSVFVCMFRRKKA